MLFVASQCQHNTHRASWQDSQSKVVPDCLVRLTSALEVRFRLQSHYPYMCSNPIRRFFCAASSLKLLRRCSCKRPSSAMKIKQPRNVEPKSDFATHAASLRIEISHSLTLRLHKARTCVAESITFVCHTLARTLLGHHVRQTLQASPCGKTR